MATCGIDLFQCGPHVFQTNAPLIYPVLLSVVFHAGCTPTEAVVCDEGLSCESGATGYTCGELPAAAVVLVVSSCRTPGVSYTLTSSTFAADSI